MFRVHGKSFPIKSATFEARVEHDDDEDRPVVYWSLDVKCDSVQVDEEVWHPNLHIEEAKFEIDDPLQIEHEETAIEAGEDFDGKVTLFLAKQDTAWGLRASFGERRGDVFDVLIKGDAWDYSYGDGVPLRIMTPIRFLGMEVSAENLEIAHNAISRFSDFDAFVVEPREGGFYLRLPPNVR